MSLIATGLIVSFLNEDLCQKDFFIMSRGTVQKQWINALHSISLSNSILQPSFLLNMVSFLNEPVSKLFAAEVRRYLHCFDQVFFPFFPQALLFYGVYLMFDNLFLFN